MSPAMYRAVHLSVPSVIAQFRTVYRDAEGAEVDSRTYNVDLNTGTTIDWDVSLQVSSPGPSTLVPPGWYVALDPGRPAHSHTLLSGLTINELDGWDVTKLGWMKAGGRDEVVTASLEQLAQAFSPQVESCAGGRHRGTFASSVKIDEAELGGGQGRPLHHLYPFVGGVRVWRRHVEVEHRESPLLGLSLQHRSRVGVVVQYSASRLRDFTGVLVQQEHSHTHLNLTLVGAAGTITGSLASSALGPAPGPAPQPAPQQSLLLRLPLLPGNSSHQLKLTAVAPCSRGQVRVSLKPLGGEGEAAVITKLLPCVSHSMRTFRSTASHPLTIPDTAAAAGARDCGVTCVSSWLYWLDPGHWLDTIWPQSRILISVILLVIIIIILTLVCKIMLAICKCCGCRRKKK